MRDVLTALEADEEIDNPEEEEVVIIEEIAKMLERQRDRLPALRDIPKNKLLKETAKSDKVLRNFKTNSITKTNELFYAGAPALTNRLGIKIHKAAERKKPM